MSGSLGNISGQLERELAYYRRECNDLGARLLRIQEEQSVAFREARRSRTVAKLIREAYRVADAGVSSAAIGLPMLGIVVENVMCDGAAFLSERQPGSGLFDITHAIGVSEKSLADPVAVPNAPAAFFTTSRSSLESPAYELVSILQLPFIFWCYDRVSGNALILGNRLENNVNRPFEAGDQELIEGALSVYLDVRGRKQIEVALREAQAILERANRSNKIRDQEIRGALAEPVEVITRCVTLFCANDYKDASEAERNKLQHKLLVASDQLRLFVEGPLDGDFAVSLETSPGPQDWPRGTDCCGGNASSRVSVATRSLD